MLENFCSDIIQTMKCFALERFNLSCQSEHTKINSRLNFNPGLALIAFWTTRSRISKHEIENNCWKHAIAQGSFCQLFSC